MKEAFSKIKNLICYEVHKPEVGMCFNQSESCLAKVRVCDVAKIVNQVAEEYSRDSWVSISDRLPEITEYYQPYWVTILTKDSMGKDFYYVRKATWNQYDKRWEEDCGKVISDNINIVAWREYDAPAPCESRIKTADAEVAER